MFFARSLVSVLEGVNEKGEVLLLVLEGVTLKMFACNSGSSGPTSTKPAREISLTPTVLIEVDTGVISVSSLSDEGSDLFRFQPLDDQLTHQWLSALCFAKCTVSSVGVMALANSWNEALQTLSTPCSTTTDSGLRRTYSWSLSSVEKSRKLDRETALSTNSVPPVHCPGFPTVFFLAHLWHLISLFPAASSICRSGSRLREMCRSGAGVADEMLRGAVSCPPRLADRELLDSKNRGRQVSFTLCMLPRTPKNYLASTFV